MSRIAEISWKTKSFIFIYSKKFENFVKIFSSNKKYILREIEEEFGEFLFEKVYIIIDDWRISLANFPVKNKNYSIILLNNKNKDGSWRDTKTLLFYLIHELCHLTEKGNYPFGKTPKDMHKRFDELAIRITEFLLENKS